MRLWRHNSHFQRRRGRKRALRIEVLRERVALDGSGLGVSDPLPWFDPGALTFSFSPDGTHVAGEQSRLFEQLAPLGDAPQWQAQFDAAFNQWLAPLGAAIREVPDSGNRFGVAGPAQGDPRFGDIRIAAIPLTQGVLATSVPHSAMVQGTWAGDILINANAHWNNLQEVYAVALHEFGHVMGLGHSADPQSPMFVHGVHDATAPTSADIEALRDLYVGIRFEDEEGDSAEQHSEAHQREAEEHEQTPAGSTTFPFDPSSAVALTPAIGSTLRYSALGTITDPAASIVYRLEPTLNEAEDLENLTLALRSTGTSRFNAEVLVFDSQGKEVESRVLHHGQGSVVVQAQDVESQDVHYVLVSPSVAAAEASQVGGFEIVMDFGPELRLSREVAEITLDRDTPAIDQSFSVSSSRLVHIHLESPGEADLQTTIHISLMDESSNVLVQFVIQPGTSRSAPLTFLTPGQYTLRLVASNHSGILPETQLTVFLDEVSIDVGPGIVDPTDVLYLACEEPGADPSYCYEYVPVIVNPPAVPDIEPSPIGPEYPWWWDYGFTCSDYTEGDLQNAESEDGLWWEFYVEACQSTTTPPTTTPPTTTPPTTTPPTTTPPTTTPPTTTPPTTTPPTTTPPTTTPPTTTPPTTTPPTTTPPTTTPPTTTPPTTTPPTTTPPTNLPPVSPWRNASDHHDVSGNSLVTAQDALLIINMLGRVDGHLILVTEAATSIHADVNGDFLVTALDALMVINSLARTNVAAEAEAGVLPVAALDSIHAASGTQRDEQISAGLLF